VQEQGFSVLISGTGVGALAAGFLVATFGTPARKWRFAACGAGLAGAALVGLSLVTGLAAAVACCALLGCGLVLFFATGQATFQLSAGEHNRGQLLGVWSTVFTGSLPAGNLIAGPAADAWGVPAVFRFQGALCGAAALALLLALALRRRRALDPPAASGILRFRRASEPPSPREGGVASTTPAVLSRQEPP
jgi:MFS family permease